MACAAHCSRDSETLSISKFHSKDAQCSCQRMSLNNRTTIAGSRRVYRKACIRLSKCACGKTDGDAASPNQKIFKNPLRGQSDRAAEFPHPHRAPGANGAELLIEGKTVTL